MCFGLYSPSPKSQRKTYERRRKHMVGSRVCDRFFVPTLRMKISSCSSRHFSHPQSRWIGTARSIVATISTMEDTTLAALAKEYGVDINKVVRVNPAEFRRMSKVDWETDVFTHAKIFREWKVLRNEDRDPRIQRLNTLYTMADTTREEVMAMTDDDFYHLCVVVMKMTEEQQVALFLDRESLTQLLVGPVPDANASLSAPRPGPSSATTTKITSSGQVRKHSLATKKIPGIKYKASPIVAKKSITKKFKIVKAAPAPMSSGDLAACGALSGSFTSTKTGGPVPNKILSRQTPKKKSAIKKSNKKATNDPKEWGDNVRDCICNFLLECHALNVSGVSLETVAKVAGYANKKSATFANAFKILKDGGIVKHTTGSVQLTDNGIDLLPSSTALPKDNGEMQNRLLKMLKTIGSSPKMGDIFNLLLDGEVHDKAALASATGYGNKKSEGFASAITNMNKLGLIEKSQNGASIKFSDLVFPFGRNPANVVTTADDPVLNVAAYGSTASTGMAGAASTNAGMTGRVLTKVTPVKKKSTHKKKLASKKPNKKSGAPKQSPDDVRESISNVLVELSALDIKELPLSFVAESVGYSVTTKNFRAIVKALKEDGIITSKSDIVSLTDHGLGVLRHVDPPKDNIETQDRLRTILTTVGEVPTKMEQTFEKLKDGKVHKRDELAAAVGSSPSTKGFTKSLAKLKTLRLREDPQNGFVQLSDKAFPFGRDEE